jgi:nucleotide-binding universal stress UspA family protein
MKVLFATDGAEHSVRAGTMLSRLADPARAEIVVMSVNGFETAMRTAQREGHYSVEDAHAAAEAAAEAAARDLRSAGFERVEARVLEGDEATTIVHAAETEGFELVVVGSGKERWLDTVVLGSVSSSVVHAAPCPVLAVHQAPESDGTIRVVVGADGSEGAAHSIGAFAALADPARCEVTVVTAAHPLALPPGGPAGEATMAQEVPDDELVVANRHVETAAGRLADAGFHVESEVVPGGAARALLEQAERRHADLVVVGARGLGRFRAKVLGSVSERVIRHAPATLVGR